MRRPEALALTRAYARCLLGRNVLHVDADIGGAVSQATESERFQPIRLSAVLAKHGFDSIGNRSQLEWFAQEGGIHAARGFGDGAFGK